MNEHHSNGFFSGFLFGLVVGAGLVFLFGTSRGKKVLQMLLDQVEENSAISELLEMPEDEDEYVGIEADEEPEDAPVKEEKHTSSGHKLEKPVAKVKRFFKGAPKKLVS